MFRLWRDSRPDRFYVRSYLPQTMRLLVLFAVESYWRLTIPARRRPCLFRETCSRHVYRITRDLGALRGMMAFWHRLRRCRLGYAIEFDRQSEPILRLADGSVTQVAELSQSMATLVEESRRAIVQTDFSSVQIKPSDGPRQTTIAQSNSLT
jgi:hypothetical protein